MAKESFKTFKELATESALYPQEAPARIGNRKQSLVIGIPKEIELAENRLCLTPESVGVLTANGHKVIVETGAGTASKYADRLYSDNGAKIAYSTQEVFEAEIVLKVEPPTKEEISWMKPSTTLISALQMANLREEYLKSIGEKRLNAFAFELIEDKAGSKPVVRSMSEIAGTTMISLAAEYLSKTQNGLGIAFGGVTGVPPVKVVIIGAGTIAEHFARGAMALGAEVRIFDNHHYKLRRIQNSLGRAVYTSIIDAHTLKYELQSADVAIGALRSQDGISACVVSEEMVMDMKEGAVIIDASISQGGCFETSRLTTLSSPAYEKHGVVHYCVPNISSRVCKTATRALSYIFTPILLEIGEIGGVNEMMRCKNWFMNGVYSYSGCLTNEKLAQRFHLKYTDPRILMAGKM